MIAIIDRGKSFAEIPWQMAVVARCLDAELALRPAFRQRPAQAAALNLGNALKKLFPVLSNCLQGLHFVTCGMERESLP